MYRLATVHFGTNRPTDRRNIFESRTENRTEKC